MFQLFILASLIIGSYGALYTIPNSTLQLGLIDPITGEIASFGPSYDNFEVSTQLTAIDFINKVFYVIAFEPSTNGTYLVGLNAVGGAMKYQMELPFTQDLFVGVGQGIDVDFITGHVYCFGHEPKSGLHTLLKVIPSENKIETLMTFDGFDVLGSVSALDPLHRMYWVEVGSNSSFMFYGIDIESASVVWVLNDNQYSLQTLAWDPVTRLMFGFGLEMNETSSYRTLVTLDSKTGQFAQVATIEEYSVIFGSESTIDWKNRILYGILQPQGNATTPFNLIGVGLDSGNVVSSPQLCNEFCPWSLEFLNKIWF